MIGQPGGPTYLARQSPAAAKNLRQIAGLHREYLHVICSRESGIDNLYDLEGGKKGRLAIGEAGSGAWLVWQNIIHEDKGYESVPVINESGILALSSVSSGDAACMLVPAGLGNGTAMEASATFGDTVRLVDATDKDFNDAKSIDGKQLYTWADIPSKLYRNGLTKGYWGDVETISWNAGVYIDTRAFTDRDTLKKFITAVSRAAINVKAEYGK